VIASLETAESDLTALDRSSDKSGESDRATGQVVGEAGEDGEDGEGGDKQPGLLAMRGIGGRGKLLDERQGDGKRKGPKGCPASTCPSTSPTTSARSARTRPTRRSSWPRRG
jgi:hypothetical protein